MLNLPHPKGRWAVKFVIMKRLTLAEADETIKGITQWFKDNPRRKVCHTDCYFKVRKNHIREDVMIHAELEATHDSK
jgi:hypothetical protein